MMKKIAFIIVIFLILAVGVHLFTQKPKRIRKPYLPVKGKIAIVLDDWGYNLHDAYILEQIKYPLTAAVLPNDKYSRAVCEELHAKGFEIILHLPMEPEEKYGLENETVMVSAPKAEILKILTKGLASVGYAKGVSNHMGSRATSDLRTMGIIFGELKKRHLYFLDSYVTSKSVCLQLARKMNLTVLKRDVFLDNVEEREYIKQQIYKLRNKARMNGWAIGIGHDRKITLEVLKEVMPEIAKDGYKFVFLSDLTR